LLERGVFSTVVPSTDAFRLRRWAAGAVSAGAILLAGASVPLSGYTYGYVLALEPEAIGFVAFILSPLPLSFALWRQRNTARHVLWWVGWTATVLVGSSAALMLLVMEGLSAGIRADGLVP
jgi:hypothetical protein